MVIDLAYLPERFSGQIRVTRRRKGFRRDSLMRSNHPVSSPMNSDVGFGRLTKLERCLCGPDDYRGMSPDCLGWGAMLLLMKMTIGVGEMDAECGLVVPVTGSERSGN